MADIVERLDELHNITGERIYNEAAEEIVTARLISQSLFRNLNLCYGKSQNLTFHEDAQIRDSLHWFALTNENFGQK
jgi:hypothetical protein